MPRPQSVHDNTLMAMLATRPWTVEDLAKELGISKYTLYRLLRKPEIATRLEEMEERSPTGAKLYIIKGTTHSMMPRIYSVRTQRHIPVSQLVVDWADADFADPPQAKVPFVFFTGLAEYLALVTAAEEGMPRPALAAGVKDLRRRMKDAYERMLSLTQLMGEFIQTDQFWDIRHFEAIATGPDMPTNYIDLIYKRLIERIDNREAIYAQARKGLSTYDASEAAYEAPGVSEDGTDEEGTDA